MARDREPYIKYRVLGAFIVPRMTTAGNRNQSRGLWAPRCLSRLLFSYVTSLSWVIPFPTRQGWYKYTGQLASKVGDRKGSMSRKVHGRASKGQTGRAIFSLASLHTVQVRSPHTPQDAGKTPIVWKSCCSGKKKWHEGTETGIWGWQGTSNTLKSVRHKPKFKNGLKRYSKWIAKFPG